MVVMMDKNQNVNKVIHQMRHDNMVADNNLASMVERIMARNCVNIGLHRPNYTSLLKEYILQSDTPYIPNKVGEISGNENLKIKYFPISLTKNAFTWFIALPSILIHSWA